MGNYTVVSNDAFDELQLNAGVLLSSFDPANPTVPESADIICTTTGGINVTCVPTYSDFGEDVDNVPNNMMEFKHLDGWDCAMAFSNIKFNQSNLALALGAADKTGTSKVVPRRDLESSDFADIWWVGDKADGGAVAVKLINALSTGGINIQTTKNGKGTMAMTITGHVSIDAQNTMPMEFYVLDALTASYSSVVLTSAGFKYGETYYTRSGAGTSESPYVYTEVAKDAVYDNTKTYYVKVLS